MTTTENECVGFKGFLENGEIVTVYCGQWRCKRCARKNAIKWSIRVSQHILAMEKLASDATKRIGVKHERHEFRFWTLTLRPSVKTAQQGYAKLPRLWDNLRKAIQRYYGSPLWQYVAFVEAHPKRSAIPHFHVITSLPVPMVKQPRTDKNGKVYMRTLRLKDLAYSCGFGFQAWDVPVLGRRAANYVAKYASKGSDEIPRGFRRVRASRHWQKLEKLDRPKLLVKAAHETNFAYIWRVQEACGLPIEELWEKWFDATMQVDNIGN